MRKLTRTGPAGGAFSRVVLASALSLACRFAALAAEPPRPATPADEPDDARVPIFLKGVDLALPAQEAFRGWPSHELTERAYWLPFQWPAFQRAVMFNRPVLLVMTVGWSRVAQRFDDEVLRDPEVLRAINDGYLAVRVDADRRPDLRLRYASGAVPSVSLLLSGGLPILSQANKSGKALPIVAGALDKPSLLFVLGEGRTYFERWPDLLRGLGERWLQEDVDGPFVSGPVAPPSSERVAEWLAGNADFAGGGFGLAPKSVVPGLAEYARMLADRGKGDLVEHARTTLDKLVASPLFDRREGGIHRVALAPEWGSIQYEKMLVSNVELVRDLTFALRASDSDALKSALRQTCSFLTKVLAHPSGGFSTAQAADPASSDGGGYWTASDKPAAPPPVLPLVLAGDNARAGAALLRAAAILDDDALAQSGRKALALVLDRSYHRGRGVDHVVGPAPDSRRFLETHADFALALLDAYDATGDRSYLDAARDAADFALSNLGSPGESGLRDHMPEFPSVGMLVAPRRPPIANARMARALTRLTAHGLGDAYRDRAIAILKKYAGDLASLATAGIEPAIAIEEIVSEPLRIEIEGDREASRVHALRRAALLLPHAWTIVDAPEGSQDHKPAAVVRWRGQTVRVERADRLAAEVARLTGSTGASGAGTGE